MTSFECFPLCDKPICRSKHIWDRDRKSQPHSVDVLTEPSSPFRCPNVGITSDQAFSGMSCVSMVLLCKIILGSGTHTQSQTQVMHAEYNIVLAKQHNYIMTQSTYIISIQIDYNTLSLRTLSMNNMCLGQHMNMNTLYNNTLCVSSEVVYIQKGSRVLYAKQ